MRIPVGMKESRNKIRSILLVMHRLLVIATFSALARTALSRRRRRRLVLLLLIELLKDTIPVPHKAVSYLGIEVRHNNGVSEKDRGRESDKRYREPLDGLLRPCCRRHV